MPCCPTMMISASVIVPSDASGAVDSTINGAVGEPSSVLLLLLLLLLPPLPPPSLSLLHLLAQPTSNA